MKRVKYASKILRSLDFRLTTVAQKRLCLNSLINIIRVKTQLFFLSLVFVLCRNKDKRVVLISFKYKRLNFKDNKRFFKNSRYT